MDLPINHNVGARDPQHLRIILTNASGLEDTVPEDYASIEIETHWSNLGWARSNFKLIRQSGDRRLLDALRIPLDVPCNGWPVGQRRSEEEISQGAEEGDWRLAIGWVPEEATYHVRATHADDSKRTWYGRLTASGQNECEVGG